jgi:PAS domain S-box-containing protein
MTDQNLALPDLLSGALLQWLDEMAAQGIFTTDNALVIRSWNRWLETHTGFSAAEMIGRPLLTAFPELVTRGFEPHYRAALSGQSRFFTHTFHRYLLPGRIAAGGEIAQNARLVPLSFQGSVVGTLTAIEDVSERVASERELRSQIEAADLARTAAEEASRVKEEFLTTLSHEIRTPLNAVVGWTKILLGRTVEPAMLERALQVIDRNALAQMRLIDDMLDMARVMSGKLRLELRPVDLAAIAFAAIDVVAPAASAKRIVVRSLVETNAPWVLGDPDRLQQVVWNLLSNSIKFTEPGGSVTVVISMAGGLVQLKVGDTGSGIPAEFLPQMFERFRQQDASANRRHGGLGLGLSLVRQLVELHGGTVAAESTIGMGTTITVALPSHDPIAMTAISDPVIESDTSALVGLRVLLVEDREDALEILTAALQQMGMSVQAARSSSQALEALDDATAAGEMPDVIISDVGLPDEDGYRLMQKLSLRDPLCGGDIPVIAVTAYGRPEDRARALAAGFRLHLTKPVTPDGLAAAILKVLNEGGRSTRRTAQK